MRDVVLPWFEIDGTVPDLVGRRCEGFVAEQYWHAGQLRAPASVVHVRFAGQRFRLYFEHSLVFWRPTEHPPQAYAMPEIDASVTLDDIAERAGTRGLTLLALETRAIPRGVVVSFQFEPSRNIEVRCIDDRAEVAC